MFLYQFLYVSWGLAIESFQPHFWPQRLLIIYNILYPLCEYCILAFHKSMNLITNPSKVYVWMLCCLSVSFRWEAASKFIEDKQSYKYNSILCPQYNTTSILSMEWWNRNESLEIFCLSNVIILKQYDISLSVLRQFNTDEHRIYIIRLLHII